MIIGFTAGEWIGLVAIGAPLIIGIFSFAFKAKILNEVNVKIAPLQSKITQLEIDMNVMTTTLDGIAEALKENHKEIKKIIFDNDESTKKLIREKEQDSNKQFENLWKAVTSKADK